MEIVIEDDEPLTQAEREDFEAILCLWSLERHTKKRRCIPTDNITPLRHRSEFPNAYTAHCINRDVSKIYSFPDELMLMIARYLEPIDTFSLGSCCYRTVFLLKTQEYDPAARRRYMRRAGVITLLQELREEGCEGRCRSTKWR
jgi:hypothetical protein